MYRLLPLEDIRVAPERQRDSLDPIYIQELANSIRDTCLMHAPVVGADLELIAGECRLEAIRLIHEMGEEFRYGGETIPAGMIPCVEVGDLSETQRYELELEENIRRKDLSWQAKVKAEARLAQLKTYVITAETGKPPTLKVLAQEIRPGGGGDQMRASLDLAKNLDHPDVARAKTREEAVKTLRRVVQAEQHAQLAAAVGAAYTTGQHHLYHADSEQWMAEATPEQFDVILTDPPYGMGADEFGDSGGKAGGAHGYADSPDNLRDIMGWFPAASFRITKPQAHLYLFCDIAWFESWSLALTRAGWRVFRTPLIWVNPTKYRAPWPEHGPQRKWEMCLYAVKGDKQVTRLFPDVITCQADENLGHTAQKPVPVYIDLLQRSILPGDRVLDPFAGSGPIFEAAHKLKCVAVGIERASVSYGIALKRLQDLQGA